MLSRALLAHYTLRLLLMRKDFGHTSVICEWAVGFVAFGYRLILDIIHWFELRAIWDVKLAVLWRSSGQRLVHVRLGSHPKSV
jgi:hypothetical protein